MKSLKDNLLRMREDLVRDISRRTKTTAEGTAPDIGDILDSVSEERTRELDMILTDREKKKLLQIEDASYGLCEECVVKIPKGRLKVMPFAKYCVECQEKLERDEKYMREEPEDGIKKAPAGEVEE
jgi:DnaK suppressor protein